MQKTNATHGTHEAAADPATEDIFDVAIIGGGLVGASLAVALQASGLSLLVIESVAMETPPHQQTSFDERTVALTFNSSQIYTGLGVWQQIAAQHAQPINEIHISESGGFGMSHLRNTDVGCAALGYVVPAGVLGKVLYQQIQRSPNISLLCPGTVDSVQPQAQHNILHISANQQKITRKARLTVVANGGRSALNKPVDHQSKRPEYPYNAILSIIETDREHHGRAYERFTNEGPLALLPHSDKRYAVVWNTAQRQTAARMALSDTEFSQQLQQAFGWRAGQFSRPSARKCYPLQRSKINHPLAPRTVLVGNAAHLVHPVAGQGFNLGLRDVAILAEILHNAAQQQQDLASPTLLKKYVALRRRETAMVRGFTDGLICLFDNSSKPIRLARNAALVAIELFPPAKRLLLRRTMGLATQPSRLSAGLPLG